MPAWKVALNLGEGDLVGILASADCMIGMTGKIAPLIKTIERPAAKGRQELLTTSTISAVSHIGTVALC
jgi:hypothetical protein